MARKLIDVSHEIEAGMGACPGLPAPVVSDYLIHCIPVKFRGVGTFPVRAYAVIE